MIDRSPASREISLTVRWLWGLSSWLGNSDSTVSTFSSVCAVLRLLVPERLSTVPNFTSSLFFVQPLFKRCNRYILADFWLKFCLIYWAASKLPRLLDTLSKFALFSECDLKDEKLIKKQTYMKTETFKLYSRDFWIFLPNIIKIDPYNFELYRLEVGPFLLRHSVDACYHQRSLLLLITCAGCGDGVKQHHLYVCVGHMPSTVFQYSSVLILLKFIR